MHMSTCPLRAAQNKGFCCDTPRDDNGDYDGDGGNDGDTDIDGDSDGDSDSVNDSADYRGTACLLFPDTDHQIPPGTGHQKNTFK